MALLYTYNKLRGGIIDNMREKILLNRNWLFHCGDINENYPPYKGFSYISAKTERFHMGPASKNYFASDDCYDSDREHKGEKWERVDIPHDYVIEELPDKKYNCALGFVPYKNAWYIKKIKLTDDDKNKRIVLFFEGIATRSTIYCNGCLIKHNFSGYNSFEADITDVVDFEKENVVSVYVNTEEHEGWWYEGGGIYRNVWLVKTNKVAVDLWGIHVVPEHLGDEKWQISTEITVRNDNVTAQKYRVVCSIFDAEGNKIAETNGGGEIADKDKTVSELIMQTDNPERWSPESPVLYTMRAEIFIDDECVDVYETRFGFRTFNIDPDKGLFINGKHYKIKGLCGHADCGLLGKAVPENIHRYKVRLMKEMGANGYRTSHYMQAESLMDALDENGFIVLDETRWFESTEESKEQLKSLILRDRNRPSVFFWSIGNEEPYHIKEQGHRIAQSLISFVKKYDKTRPIFTAVSYSPNKSTVYDDCDVIAINYNWKLYDEVRRLYPGKAVISSECCATGSTRGWYFGADESRAFLPAYDRDTTDEFRSRQRSWKFIDENDWILGGYQWIAFEHRGEACWPRLCSQSGAIDLFMQKKDAFYQNLSYWSDGKEKPMIHLLPHWNFKGMEGEKIRVVAYTNAEEAELFLNGNSLGKEIIAKYGYGEWFVPYEVGELRVNAYIDGKIVATDCKVTSENPYKLALRLDTEDIKANGRDIALFTCSVLDEKGNEVPDADATVNFIAEGAGKILSTGSDITDHDSLFLSQRKMRAGKITVAVKLGEKAGNLKLVAMSTGLKSAVLNIELK